MSFRIYLEIIRALAVLFILVILLRKGKPIAVDKRNGYRFIIIGFSLIVFASLLDITDNFPALDKFLVVGDTPLQAILEKVVGYLFGFLFMALGFWKWLPAVSELQVAQDGLRDSLERERSLREEIQRDRNHLLTTLHSIGDGVISTDAGGRVMIINQTAQRLTGWKADEAVGRMIDEVFKIANELTKTEKTNPLAKVLETNDAVVMDEHIDLISKSGDRIPIADSAAPVRDADGKIAGAVLVFRDVSDLNELLKERLKNQRLESLELLAGGIAHDFNNLLMGIKGNISLGLMSENLKDDDREVLESASLAARRAAELTSQLLTFSKGSQPKKELAHLPEIVRESADFVLSGSVVKCEYQIDDGVSSAFVDKGQISQVVQNLVINARQAMNESGDIKISIFNNFVDKRGKLGLSGGAFVVVEISDSGPGISAENLDRLFDPYFTTKDAGNGLGLATSFSIIKKHGGTITVSSKPGEGATFAVVLPAAENVSAAADVYVSPAISASEKSD